MWWLILVFLCVPATCATLDSQAVSSRKLYFGTATDNLAPEEENDTQYQTLLGSEFGCVTPGNSMKWDHTEPSQGTFDFAAGDAIVNFTQAHGQIIRGHNLVWYQQLPSWVTAITDAYTLENALKNHITSLVTRWKGFIYAWDVINEPFNDDGTFRNNIFYNLLGDNYITIALEAAAAADPHAKLYINDYNVEYGNKFTAMYQLVKSLKDAGTPIHGLGIEAHYLLGGVPTNLSDAMQSYISLGVEVAITELDIRMELPVTTAKLAQQAVDYAAVTKACVQTDGCVGLTVWDFTDKYSWIPAAFPGYGAACPYDVYLNKKQAYDSVELALVTPY